MGEGGRLVAIQGRDSSLSRDGLDEGVEFNWWGRVCHTLEPELMPWGEASALSATDRTGASRGTGSAEHAMCQFLRTR